MCCLCATPHLGAASNQTLPLRATRPEEHVLEPRGAARSVLNWSDGWLSTCLSRLLDTALPIFLRVSRLGSALVPVFLFRYGRIEPSEPHR